MRWPLRWSLLLTAKLTPSRCPAVDISNQSHRVAFQTLHKVHVCGQLVELDIRLSISDCRSPRPRSETGEPIRGGRASPSSTTRYRSNCEGMAAGTARSLDISWLSCSPLLSSWFLEECRSCYANTRVLHLATRIDWSDEDLKVTKRLLRHSDVGLYATLPS